MALCFGIALVSALFVFAVAKRGRQRLAARLVVMTYVFAAMPLKLNYSLVRDHVRWLFLSSGYEAQVLAQFLSEELKHAEWDGWVFMLAAPTTQVRPPNCRTSPMIPMSWTARPVAIAYRKTCPQRCLARCAVS
jgi:hypothetical protein